MLIRWTCVQEVAPQKFDSPRAAVTLSCNDTRQVFLTHFIAHVSVTKQYNLILAKRRRCCVARKVTAGLAESNVSLPLGL